MAFFVLNRTHTPPLSVDSTAWASQMTASPGLPTTLQTLQSSVCEFGGPVVRTSGSLHGGTTGFNSRADSFLCIYQWYRILYTSGPSLDTVLTNLQTSFNAIQYSFRGLQLLFNASKTKCMLFNRLLPTPSYPTSITTLDGSDLEYVDNYYYYFRRLQRWPRS